MYDFGEMRTITLSIALASLLIGCGGGSSSDDTSVEPVVNDIGFIGTASDGYIKNATVCFDINNDSVCQASEPNAQTNNTGDYNLSVTQEDLNSAVTGAGLVLVGGIDIDNNKPLVGSLRAPYDPDNSSVNITPISTMVAVLVENNVSVDAAYTQVANALGLTEAEVYADPVALAENNNTNALAVSMALQRSAELMADNNDTQAVYNLFAQTTQAVNEGNVTALLDTIADNNTTVYAKKAQVASVAAQQVMTLVQTEESIVDAALLSDSVVDYLNSNVIATLDENTTVDTATLQTAVESNINEEKATLIQTAIENILNSYNVPYTLTEIEMLDGIFATSSEVNVESLITEANQNPLTQSLGASLEHAYKTNALKMYVESLGLEISDTDLAKIDLDQYSVGMDKVAFSQMLYATQDASLMALSLEISPPEGMAAMSDVENAKAMFDSVRTQLQTVTNDNLTGYADTESTDIQNALDNVVINVSYAGEVINAFDSLISDATDQNLTQVEGNLSSEQTVVLTKSTSTGNIRWQYDINNTQGETWNGEVTYSDVDPDTFDVDSFNPIAIHLEGDLPLGAEATQDAAIDDVQAVNLDINLAKVANGAVLGLQGSISSNGDTIALSDAQISLFYTTGSASMDALLDTAYVTVDYLYIDGVAGKYHLAGKIDITSYVQNEDSSLQEGVVVDVNNSYVNGNIYCASGSEIVVSSSSDYNLTYDGVIYTPNYIEQHTNSFYIAYNLDDVTLPTDGSLDATQFFQSAFSASCLDNSSITSQVYVAVDDENKITNNGWFPNDVTFDGKLTNTENNSYFDGNITLQWVDARTYDLESDEIVKGLVDFSGKLQMPEAPLMNVDIAVDTTEDNVTKIDTTYVHDNLAVSSHSIFDTELENGSVAITSSGVAATLYVVDGAFDYNQSTLTTSDGATLGHYEEISGAPVIKYVDGTFETLP